MASTSKSGKIGDGEKMKAAGDQTVFDTSEMETQIETLKAEIAKLKAQAESSGERSFHALKNIASDGIDQVRSQGEAAMQNLRDNAGDLEAQVIATVREKPVTSLAIAAGVGFLFALMTRR
ncbi:MAG: hypothetical protein WBA44_03800 [Mesorhizobium sp.]